MSYVQGELRPFRPKSAPGAVVTIKTPTERTKRRIFSNLPAGVRKLVAATAAQDRAPTDEEIDRIASASAADEIAFYETSITACVERIDGYEHRGRVITTPEELCEFGTAAFIREVSDEIMLELSLTEKEKSFLGPPSASSDGPPTSSTEPAPSTASAAA